jgi:ribosomal protein L13
MCEAARVERHEILTLADGEAVGRLAMAIAEALHAQARHVEAVVEARYRGGKETPPRFGKG